MKLDRWALVDINVLVYLLCLIFFFCHIVGCNDIERVANMYFSLFILWLVVVDEVLLKWLING